MGERMHNNGQLAAGPQQKQQQQQAQALSPTHAHPTYHMPPPTNTHRPLADDQPRTNSVENLLQGRNQAQPKSDINSSSNGSGSSSSSSAGRPLRDRLHASSSPHHSGEALGPPQKLNSQRAHDQQPQGAASPYASASARPLSQVSSQLPSTSAVSYAGRQQLYSADTIEAGPMQARVPPPTGSFGPSQYIAGQAPFRRARPHAATIGDPMASSQAAMHSRPPPQQQQGFRFYPQQQPAPGYDSRHMQQQVPHSDSRPRRLSFLGAQVVGEGHREQYETSFARSTSNTGPHFGPGGQQPSPQSQFYASRQPMHPQQHQYQQMHSMLPPPPASAPSHQQNFGHVANQGQRPHGGPAGTYGPRSSYGPSGTLQPRSLSPQAHPRHQFPMLDRFDAADGPQQRQQPMAFPRIPSPMEKPVAMQATPTSGSTATAGTAAAANATSQSPVRETTRRLSSVVWGPTGFERLESGLSRCRICGKEYSRGSSTGTLKRHFRQHQVNVPLAGSYARASSPGPAPGSRPRAYSHRVDMRARRDVSPFAPAIPPRPSQQQQQNPVQLPVIRHAQQMRQPMSPPQHSMMIEHKHMLPMLITPETPSASSAMGTLFSRSSGRSVDDMDTSSAIAGSALLSMAAGDSRMAVDSEGGRRIQRLSDPMPFQMPSAPAHVSEAGDISVSPTPSVSSSPSSRHLHFLRDNVVGSSRGFRQQPFNQPIVLPPLQNIPNFNEADEMDVVSDGDDAQPLLKRPRRATVAGVQSVAFRGDDFPAELRPEIDSLSPSQLIALSSELVRRVAKVLPVLAIEAADTVAAAASKSDAASTDPVDMLVGHIKRTLLDIPNSPRDDETHHDRLPSPSSLLSFLSSPQSAPATVSSCSLPFIIRKQVPLSQLSSQSTSSTMSLLSRVSAAMQRIAPLSLAELEWDNVGILLEAAKPRANANKVFLTIDLTTATLEEALKDPSVGVIVAYHPPIFSAWKSLTMGNLKQSLVLRCASAGVSIYSPHTSLDSCANGINDWLASLVGEGKVTPITPAKVENAAGQENAGHGRLLELATPRSLSDIVAGVKTRLALNHVRVARAPRHEQDEELVSRIAICAGSGESVVGPVAADLYFTGEMGHHDVLAAVAKNTSCILAEHTNTERGYLQGTLKARLQQELNADFESDSTDVLVSRLDRDPITIE